jgi:hypothetical protein
VPHKRAPQLCRKRRPAGARKDLAGRAQLVARQRVKYECTRGLGQRDSLCVQMCVCACVWTLF